MGHDSSGPGHRLTTLPNGVRVSDPHALARQRQRAFVRTGSATARACRASAMSLRRSRAPTRDAARINIDAERWALRQRTPTRNGLPPERPGATPPSSCACWATSCAAPRSRRGLERERQMQEYLRTRRPDVHRVPTVRQVCYGAHPVAQAVIGTRRNSKSASPATTAGHWTANTPAPTGVGVAGNVATTDRAQAEAAFGDMPTGSPHAMDAPSAARQGRARPAAARAMSCWVTRSRPEGRPAPLVWRGVVRRRHELAADERDPRTRGLSTTRPARPTSCARGHS